MRDGFIFVILLFLALSVCSPSGCEDADAAVVQQ
jgi:hypothetical protein